MPRAARHPAFFFHGHLHMKALGEAAVDLPWILPCASSLVRLTRPDAAAVWSEVRFDPGCVLLLARLENTAPFNKLVHGPAALDKALGWLSQTTPPAPPSQGGRDGSRIRRLAATRRGLCVEDRQPAGAGGAHDRRQGWLLDGAGLCRRTAGALGLAGFMRHLRRTHPRVFAPRQAAGQLATNRVGARSYRHHPPAGSSMAASDLAHGCARQLRPAREHCRKAGRGPGSFSRGAIGASALCSAAKKGSI